MTHDEAMETLAAERYLLDEMSEVERHSFEEHFFDCAECAESVRLGGRLRDDARALFPAVASSRPARVKVLPFWRRPSSVLPWAAAATLALALVYQTNRPQAGADVQALAPVALRPASRGAVPEVALPDAAHAAVLALDVNIGAPGERVTYRLAREDGEAVAGGDAVVPAPGAPLIVLVPRRRLEGGGTFLLTLSLAGGSATPPSEYRFTVAPR